MAATWLAVIFGHFWSWGTRQVKRVRRLIETGTVVLVDGPQSGWASEVRAANARKDESNGKPMA
jgi:hypothetical protein